MGYFGSRSCDCLPEEDIKYFGSFRDKNFHPTQKIILKDDYQTREETIVDDKINLSLDVDVTQTTIQSNEVKEVKEKKKDIKLPKVAESKIKFYLKLLK
jgi:hypothetical protein